MSASATDKLKKLSRRWVSQIGAGGVADGTTQTIPLASVTNLPTDTAVVFTIDRVDANGVATPNLEETVIGVVSGSNLANSVRGAEGTAQAHLAGAVVEVLVTAKGNNDIVDWGLVEHNQDGTHKPAYLLGESSGKKIQTGLSAYTGNVAAGGITTVTVTFPVAFSTTPISVVGTPIPTSTGFFICSIQSISASAVTFNVMNVSASTTGTAAIYYIAYGAI